MFYLSQNELKKMLLFSFKKIEENKEEIDKINVFPVPDQDTGTNLARTLEGIKKEIEKKDFKDLESLSQVILNGVLISAQGNVGVIFTGFLIGFLLTFCNKNPISAKKMAEAFINGAKKAKNSIQEPKEGTILDVIESSAKTFEEESKRTSNIVDILKATIFEAKKALILTKQKLPILKRANVVDAGGLGFLMILESFLEVLEPQEKPEEKRIEAGPKKFIQILSNRFEVVSLISNPKFDEKETKEKLKKLGNSLDIVKLKNKMKVHIHTDFPEEVKNALGDIGKIESLRVEDMSKEIVGEPSLEETSIGLVVDNIASLLPKIKERYLIEEVSLILDWPEMEKIPGKNIFEKLRKAEKMGIKTFPKTSQAPPGAFLKAYQRQLEKFEKVICLVLSSKISKTHNSALAARNMLEKEKKERIFVFDTQNAAAGEALLVLKAIELLQEKRKPEEILKILENFISKTHTYVIFEEPKYIESIGRITKSQANWIRRMKKIGIQPLIKMEEGVLKKGGIVFSKSLSEALFKKLKKESKKEIKAGKKLRAVIQHCDNEKEAKKLKGLLRKIGVEISFVSLGPDIFSVAGPGSLILGWQPGE